MLPDLDSLVPLVRAAAQQELRAGAAGHRKPDGSLVTQADLAMQRRMQQILAERWPAYGFYGEEMSEAEQRRALAQSEAGLWCLDPLDGTTNFAAGVPFYSVSLALLVRGAAVLGLIYDPMRDECFTAAAGRGARMNGTPLHGARVESLKRAIAAVDFKRLPATLSEQLVRHSPYASQRNFGSSALEWGWLAAGRVQVLLHGGQKVWDYAAGSLVLREAGGIAATLEGEPLGMADMRTQSVVAATNPQLYAAWQDWVACHR